MQFEGRRDLGCICFMKLYISWTREGNQRANPFPVCYSWSHPPPILGRGPKIRLWLRPLLSTIAREWRKGLKTVFGVQMTYCAAMFEITCTFLGQYSVTLEGCVPTPSLTYCWVLCSRIILQTETPYCYTTWIYKQLKDRVKDKREPRTYS